jgi:predicted DNA-binding ArsR family transcriptional regulator
MEVSMNMKRFLPIGILLAVLAVTGCGTSGKEFNEVLYDSIQNGHTTQEEVESMFGLPFKKGVQNGKEIWVYEHNKYRLIGKDTSKDLVIIFDKAGVVETHQFMTSQPTS